MVRAEKEMTAALPKYTGINRQHLESQMLSMDTQAILKNTRLTALARSEGPSLYAKNCSACHGADMRGDSKLGTPNLTDDVWLYGEGSVFDIERTVLYGVRSGTKSRNVTDMPPFGLGGAIGVKPAIARMGGLRDPFQPGGASGAGSNRAP